MAVESELNQDLNPFDGRKLGKLFLLTNVFMLPAFMAFFCFYQTELPLQIQYNNESMMPAYNLSRLPEWTPAELKTNPREWPGEGGLPFENITENKKKVDKLFKRHNFNILVSDRIPVNRTLPDFRSEECRQKPYPFRLPTASVIIVFHNEAYSTLLRTIHSIIQTSPKALLREIILIDDRSTKASISRHLVHYIGTLPVKVKFIRRSIRTGLIRSRVLGAAIAEGDVLVFLDSHCETAPGWLEPLLDRIASDRSRVVSPIVDVIDEKTFGYGVMSDGVYGGFDWRLRYRWLPVPPREVQRRKGKPTEPLRSPVPNGGMYAIDKEFFFRLGGYDEDKLYFSGESVELGMRVWMCGGSVEIVPCSRVGHVFRHPIPYRFPYNNYDEMTLWNAARTVEIWLDNFRMFYYNLYPESVKKDRGNVTFLRTKKEELKCKDLPWYITNIFPEVNIPLYYQYFGQIENVHSKYCIDFTQQLTEGTEEAKLRYCHWEHGGNPISFTQMFLLTKENRILSDEFCLDSSGPPDNKVILHRCTNSTSEIWKYDKERQQIKHKASKLCLQFENNKTLRPILRKCDRKVNSQKWFMRNNFDWRPPAMRR